MIKEGTTLANPYWEYSRKKIACEGFLLDKYRNEGFPVTIVRPSHTYDERNIPLGVHGKKGFYQIAMEANVPIGLSHIDFRTRTLGVGQMFYPTGDYEKDMVEIEKYYHGMRGYHKGWFNLENEPVTPHEWDKN